jgi:hypothetical protein
MRPKSTSSAAVFLACQSRIKVLLETAYVLLFGFLCTTHLCFVCCCHGFTFSPLCNYAILSASTYSIVTDWMYFFTFLNMPSVSFMDKILFMLIFCTYIHNQYTGTSLTNFLSIFFVSNQLAMLTLDCTL